MKHRMTVVFLLGLLFLLARAGSAQTGSPTVDWKGLDESWKAYCAGPSEAGAEKMLNLLPGNVKITDVRDGFLVVNSIYDRLGVLESEMYAGNSNAIKLGFRLFTISYGTFETALNNIIGKLIIFSPRLFLEELAAHRDLFPSLDPIVASFVREMPDDPAAQDLEKKMRIRSLEAVEEKPLKSLRNECLKILKKL